MVASVATITAPESCSTFQFETTRRLATLRALANPPAGATGPILSANNGNQMPELPSTPYSQFPAHSSLCRMPYAVFKCYCKFNNKYKSFSELTAKARPPHASNTQAISIFSSISISIFLSISIFVFVFACLVGPLLGFLTSSVRTRDTCCARQDGRTNGHGQTPIDGHFSSHLGVSVRASVCVSGLPCGRSKSSAAVVLIFYHFEIKEQHLGVEPHPGPTTAAGCCRQCFASCPPSFFFAVFWTDSTLGRALGKHK